MLIEEWLQWLQIASMGMSFILTAFMLWRYFVKREKHILIWTLAWLLVGIRVVIGLSGPKFLITNFMNDSLTIAHDLLWFLGLAILLRFTYMKRYIFPLIYLFFHLLISGVLYFWLKSNVYAAIETTIFAHPILLFILSWYFYICSRAIKSMGAKIISTSFFFWALDYIIFGVGYFGMGNQFAGILGWGIGLIFRIVIFIGFLKMTVEK